MHIQNRCPTAAVENKTPEEAWSGTKPAVEYFRIFGCLAHAHVLDQKRTKVDDKSRKCVFIGVSDESKAWRLFDPISKTIIISRDLVFEEDESWDWSNTELKIQQDELSCDDEGDVEGENNHNGGEDADDGSEGEDEDDGGHSTSLDSSQGRGERARRAPRWMADYAIGEGFSEEENLNVMMMMTENDPVSFEEAMLHKHWHEAMTKEIATIEKNHTWKLRVLPDGV